MERLTFNDLNKVSYDPWELCGMDKHCTKGCHEDKGCTKGCHILKLYRKLAEYEDLEEHGQLIKLPCKVGDTIFVKLNLARSIYKAEVRDFIHFISCGFCVVVTSDLFDKQKIPFSEFGKTVFRTREEAEQALKEMEVIGNIFDNPELLDTATADTVKEIQVISQQEHEEIHRGIGVRNY